MGRWPFNSNPLCDTSCAGSWKTRLAIRTKRSRIRMELFIGGTETELLFSIGAQNAPSRSRLGTCYKHARTFRAARASKRCFQIQFNGALTCALRFQFAIEKIGAGFICLHPVLMQQEVMNFVGENELLEMDPLLAQRPRKFYRLREIHIAVVVAVNQQHRRLPFLDRSDGR